MAEIIAEFFQIVGVSAAPPSTMAELIPYLLTVFIGLVLVLSAYSAGVVHVNRGAWCMNSGKMVQSGRSHGADRAN